MTVEEIFSQLSAHMVKGLMIHDKISSAYGFLNLHGYQKCHEYHYHKESCDYKCLQDFFLTHFNKLIPEVNIETPEIIPQSWYKYVRQNVDSKTKSSAVKDLMKKWVDWEEDTQKLLKQLYKELMELNEIAAALEIASMIKDNCKELSAAKATQINLEYLDYNAQEIVDKQDIYYKEFCKKIKHMYEED